MSKKKRFLPNKSSELCPWVYDHSERHSNRINHATIYLSIIKHLIKENDLQPIDITIINKGLPGMCVVFRYKQGSKVSLLKWLPGTAKLWRTIECNVVPFFFIKIYDYLQAIEQIEIWLKETKAYYATRHT